MTDPGKVTISVPSVPAGAGSLVKVRDQSLRLVGRSTSGAELELDEGLYLASVVLPSGEEHEQAIHVSAGEALEVTLGPEQGVDSLVQGELLEADLPRGLVFNAWSDESGASAPPDQWYARLVRATDGAPVFEPLTLQSVEHAADDAGSVTDLECRASGDQDHLVWLQVAVPDQVPFNCALPMMPHTPDSACRIRVVATSAAIRATAVPVSTPLVETIAAYLVSGYPGHAAEVGEQAMKLLYEKRQDPVAATLGAYALLRLDHLRDVEDWVRNLATWFPELPDGAAIAAELAARAGDDEGAKRWLIEATRRGTPMFADGLSLLVSRLRPLAPAVGGEAGINRLLEISVLADFAQLVVAYPAADLQAPAASQYPPTGFDPDAGWKRFGEG